MSKYDEQEKLMCAFLRQYPKVPDNMKKIGTWCMDGLLGDREFEFNNRYGKNKKLSIRKGVIVQLDFVRENIKNIINSRLCSEQDYWSQTQLWQHTASVMGRLFLLNRAGLADKVYRYMEDLCKKT